MRGRQRRQRGDPADRGLLRAPSALQPTHLLYLAVFLVYSDTDLLAPNLSDCARDFGYNSENDEEKDSQLGGGLSMGVFLVGAPAAFLLGCLADRGFLPRETLLVWILVLGGAGCCLSALAPNYPALFLARSLTGVSIAGAMPLSYALASQWHGPSVRLTISSRLGVWASLGALAGQGLSGLLGARWGWRVPFGVVGSMILGGAVLSHKYLPPQETKHANNALLRRGEPLTVHSAKGHSVGAASSSRWSQWSSLLHNRTYWLLLLQGIPGCVPWSVFGTFWPDYLHQQVGYTVPHATLVVMAFQAGNLIGTILTGYVGQWLYNKWSPQYPSILMVALGLIRIPIVKHMFDVPQTSLWQSCAIAFVSGVASAPTGALVRPTLQNVVAANQQGVAFASFVLTDDLGRGLGPWWVRRFSGTTRRAAFVNAMNFWIPNAVLGGLTYFTVVRDEANVKKQLLLEKEGGAREHHDSTSHRLSPWDAGLNAAVSVV